MPGTSNSDPLFYGAHDHVAVLCLWLPQRKPRDLSRRTILVFCLGWRWSLPFLIVSGSGVALAAILVVGSIDCRNHSGEGCGTTQL